MSPEFYSDSADPKWIKVYVPDEFQKIRVLFAHYRLVAVLEKVTATMMAEIERNGVSCQKATHKLRELLAHWPQQQVRVV